MVATENATVAALLTPPSPGAVAVVALTGPDTLPILERILRHSRRDEPLSFQDCFVDQRGPLPHGRGSVRFGRPRLCRIVEGDAFLDDAVVTVTAGPRGMIAEVCTHGGVRIVQRVLMLLQRAGATIVAGWEFAVLHGAAHPVEGEVDRALLTCRSRRLARWLLRQRVTLPRYLARIGELDAKEQADFVARSRVAIRLLQGVVIALVGPPNAGKSTLANRLIGHDRILTADVPGTTRDWVSETALIDGWPVTLTDTAGIRETQCAIESEAIRRGKAALHGADVILVVLDGTVSPHERRRVREEVCRAIPDDRDRLILVNKRDDPGYVASEDEGAAISISARTGDGVSEVETRVSELMGWNTLDERLPTAIAPEHLAAVDPSGPAPRST